MTQEATRPFCYGKIHRAVVTDAQVDYVGSITIDPVLLRASGILPYTQVDVVNVNNGNRLQTYVIEGTEG
ncbi:aspartate 1-decarboxylase, partial [Escherichia coli]|uniref:aspartate 1-decarboxylase n=1 Tax=Escherichia coli TaxID=562 RepID=UPI0010FA3D0C